MGIAAYGQEVDFSTYNQLIKRGKVTIVCQKDEYRMIVGSLKKPKISMLIGTSPETAVGSLDNLLRKGKDETVVTRGETIGFGGVRFSLTVSGPVENRQFSLTGLMTPSSLSLANKIL